MNKIFSIQKKVVLLQRKIILQCKTIIIPNNMETKNLLRNFLITGSINPMQQEHIKDKIFEACKMNKIDAKDRMNWSNWVNAKVTPNRFVQAQIDDVMASMGYKKIYSL